MREADLTPTPGRRRSASTRASSEWVSELMAEAPHRGPAKTRRRFSERELHATRQARHAGGELGHLLLRGFLGLAHRRIESRSHQVFEHVLVVGQQAGVDGDAL